ncbi:transposase, partial [Corynebacterium casei]
GVERWSMMKKFKKHTPEQIVGKLDQAAKLKAEGKTNADVARDLKVSEATLHRWQKTYGQMDRAGARELKALRDENDRLKKLLGEAELDKAAYKELAEGKF